jgi:hypothetical protein
MGIPKENYSKEMLELLDLYYESGIWKKYNWYDFLVHYIKTIHKIKRM